jgi:hypothetical protein
MGHNEAANPPRPATMVRPKGKKCRWPTIPTLHLKGNQSLFLKSFISNIRITS